MSAGTNARAWTVSALPAARAVARRGQLVAYLLLTAIGAAAAIAAVGYGVWIDEGRVGAGFLPLLAGLLLCGTCAGLAAVSLRRGSRDAGPPALTGRDARGRGPAQRTRNLWTVVAATLAMLLALPHIGLLAAFGAYILAISTLVEKRRWWTSLLMALAVVAVVHVVFGVLLAVPLPAWSLGVAP